MSQRMHKIKRGNVDRWSFSKIKDIIDIPYLIEVQKKSYDAFINQGIREVLADFSPITDFSNKIELSFLEHKFKSESKYTVKEAKRRDATYTLSLSARVRLLWKETGAFIDEDVFMGEIPRMTENGTFIINGAERVVVSQLVRSPGVYTTAVEDKKSGLTHYETQVIPSRGAWLEYIQDTHKDGSSLSVKVDRTRKISATLLLRALGYGTNEEILTIFGNDEMIANTLKRDGNIDNVEDAKIDIYRKLRPGEVPTQSAIDAHLQNLFFDTRRYDLSKVGRYKFNKHLSLANRIEGHVLAEDVITEDGEVLAMANDTVTREQADAIQNAGINSVMLKNIQDLENLPAVKVIGNNTVDLNGYVDCDPAELGITEKVYYPTLKSLIEASEGDMEVLKASIKANVSELVCEHISIDDIIATMSYNVNMRFYNKELRCGYHIPDNIDHLSNRRVRSVGELLQNQFRIGMSRLERVVHERMMSQDIESATPRSLINIRPVSSAIREFFGSSQLSQFMDQPNPIAELTHKRKLSALGPGGLNRERAGFEVRDVHHSHYGRMCPIETPEGQNIGLITSLSSYAKVNEYGFIESPYRKVDKESGKVTDIVEYLAADEEDKYIVAQANEPLDEEGRFANKRVTCRYRDAIKEFSSEKVDYMDVSPQQLVSIATSLIPFLENDDANRALMGSNMQRQAVPLLRPEAPIVGTGMEHVVAHDSGVCILAKEAGVVTYVSANKIEVTSDSGVQTYELQKFVRSNQGTCINQKPVVRKGDVVKVGDTLADGPSTENGELALGRNILIGFMTWEGYNYEDAILISEELVKNDVFTTIHIEKHELECRDTKLGAEQITRDIPNVSEEVLKNLDENGIVRIGAEVRVGDYLVGKVTPKGETELTPEERLLRAIFGEKAREVRDVSLKVPNGGEGTVVDVQIFSRANKDELAPQVNQMVRVFIAQKRKIGVGDKMAGRHGNKGVISRVLPKEDMPFLADGTPLQIVLNPLGVPSRMNIGQVLEVHLGLVAKLLGIKVATPVFDGATETDIQQMFLENKLPANGKLDVYDGRTGEKFENPVTVGYMYMLKLIHLVDDKIHARSVGPYSLVTQQPLGGKAQFGGQRFGEMEVWALEAYGAANILQEMLTVKSDDVMGRQKVFDSIIKPNATMAAPGLPEAFKVLKKEMQSLCMDVKLLTDTNAEVELAELDDDQQAYEPIIPGAHDDNKGLLDSMDDESDDTLFGANGYEALFSSMTSSVADTEDEDLLSSLGSIEDISEEDDDDDDDSFNLNLNDLYFDKDGYTSLDEAESMLLDEFNDED